ncbi:MAG TPA: alkaline phosphatase family protein [Acidisarcina sp.]|nr:alkaline phosphatase family protein [Acidisarcina sp.]
MLKIRRSLILLLACVTMLGAALQARAGAYDGRPKLVVILVIDQFRGDYLERYRADFKGHGFRLFLDRGAYFPDCYYDYANLQTAPGHSTLGTGAYTDGHGIGTNEWWDLSRNKERPVSSVEDERYRLVGLPDSSIPANAPGAPPNALSYGIGSSPRNLRASTIGDELRLATQGQSHVFGISLKDRASILPAGATANAAYWIDPASGYFVTSTFYRSQLPEWATAFNTGGRSEQAMKDANATGTTMFYDLVGRTPAANAYELDFARALIKGEQLAQGPTPDLLTISLSANDILGHQMGPDSTYEKQMVDHLDSDLDSFFTWLDKNIDGGLANVWIALSADHGVAPIPSDAARLGLNAATLDVDRFTAALNEAMNQKFSPGEKVNYLLPHQNLPYIALNNPAFDRAGINEAEAEHAVQNAIQPAVVEASKPREDADTPAQPNPGDPGFKPSETRLPPQPVVVRTYTREQLAAGQFPPTEFGSILGHSYTTNGGWYVMVIPAAYQMENQNSSQTTHFSPWSYDRHVPLAFFGAPFTPGTYHGRVAPVDLAATLASLLGVNQPSASVGRILTQAIHPLPPLPPARSARHRSTRALHKPVTSPENQKAQ